MKKYLFGIFAIALAIGFSAFTSTNKVVPSKKTTNYFWYELNASKTATLGSTVNPSAAVDEATEIPNYGNCLDQDAPKCLVGFTSSSVTSGTSVTGITDETRIIRETEQ